MSDLHARLGHTLQTYQERLAQLRNAINTIRATTAATANAPTFVPSTTLHTEETLTPCITPTQSTSPVPKAGTSTPKASKRRQAASSSSVIDLATGEPMPLDQERLRQVAEAGKACSDAIVAVEREHRELVRRLGEGTVDYKAAWTMLSAIITAEVPATTTHTAIAAEVTRIAERYATNIRKAKWRRTKVQAGGDDTAA